jgi:hypothetical protein
MGLPAALKVYKEKLNDKAAMARFKEKAKEKAESAIETAAVIGGGALAGYVGANYDTEFMGVNAGLAAGAALTVVGIMGWAGRSSHIVGSLGEGMLAYEVGKRVATQE